MNWSITLRQYRSFIIIHIFNHVKLFLTILLMDSIRRLYWSMKCTRVLSKMPIFQLSNEQVSFWMVFGHRLYPCVILFRIVVIWISTHSFLNSIAVVVVYLCSILIKILFTYVIANMILKTIVSISCNCISISLLFFSSFNFNLLHSLFI